MDQSIGFNPFYSCITTNIIIYNITIAYNYKKKPLKYIDIFCDKCKELYLFFILRTINEIVRCFLYNKIVKRQELRYISSANLFH